MDMKDRRALFRHYLGMVAQPIAQEFIRQEGASELPPTILAEHVARVSAGVAEALVAEVEKRER